MSDRLQIRTPSRLHFGLFGWGPEIARQFGGVGLMIEAPGVKVVVERAAEWSAQGPLASRLEAIIAQLRARSLESGLTLPAARVSVVCARRSTSDSESAPSSRWPSPVRS